MLQFFFLFLVRSKKVILGVGKKKLKKKSKKINNQFGEKKKYWSYYPVSHWSTVNIIKHPQVHTMDKEPPPPDPRHGFIHSDSIIPSNCPTTASDIFQCYTSSPLNVV